MAAGRASATCWGITLQPELTYSNVLEMLDLAGIPLHADERGEDDPIVMAGGPCASNPEPLAPFFDVLLHGRGRGGAARGRRVIGGCRRARERLAAGRRCPTSTCPARGRQRRSSARSTRDFAIETQPTKPVVPYASRDLLARHGRGDARLHPRLPLLPRRHLVPAGARAAGRRGGPGRPRAARCTGYDELSLTSLATSDYTDIVAAIRASSAAPGLHLSLPSNRVDTGPIALTAAANSRQSSITLAPEAGTQRMRDIICKTITDEMIEGAIRAAFAAGYTASRCTT